MSATYPTRAEINALQQQRAAVLRLRHATLSEVYGAFLRPSDTVDDFVEWLNAERRACLNEIDRCNLESEAP